MKIRGHHFLCILAFRGKGYDELFTQVFKQLVYSLHLNPKMVIEAKEEPDIICAACPLRVSKECGSEGDGGTVIRDKKALQHLGIKPDTKITWNQVMHKISETKIDSMIEDVCADCLWLKDQNCALRIKETLKTGI
ncbi:MAG: DUF1284 domain-containing protein [Bacillota bacterium]|jgi:hypothetical protein